MKKPNKCQFPLLINLAMRLRLARKCVARAQHENYPKEMIAELEGALREAHNSFQAAKQITAAHS